jgi:hypothetical protein
MPEVSGKALLSIMALAMGSWRMGSVSSDPPKGSAPVSPRVSSWKGVMAAQAILVVVVVREAGMRSALAAHLSLDGFELLSASNIGFGLLGSTMIREPSVLVIDEALIPCDAETWIEKQRSVGNWRHLVVVNGITPVPVDGASWLIRISHHNARQMLSELLRGWVNDESLLGKTP